MLITAPIIFTGNEYIDNPDKVILNIDEVDKARIIEAQYFMKQRGHIVSMRLDVVVDKYTDSEDEEVEFASSTDELIVYREGGIYYYGQHKHDSSAQIESNDITKTLFQ